MVCMISTKFCMYMKIYHIINNQFLKHRIFLILIKFGHFYFKILLFISLICHILKMTGNIVTKFGLPVECNHSGNIVCFNYQFCHYFLKFDLFLKNLFILFAYFAFNMPYHGYDMDIFYEI